MKRLKLLFYSLCFSVALFAGSLNQLKVESPNKVTGSITPNLIALPASVLLTEKITFSSISDFLDLVGSSWDITLTTYSDNGTTVIKETTKRVSITKNPQTESVTHDVTPVGKTGKIDYYCQITYKRVSDGYKLTTEKPKMVITQTSVTWSAKVYISNTVSRPNNEIWVGDRVKTYTEVSVAISPTTEKVVLGIVDMDASPSSAAQFEDDDESPQVELTNGQKFVSKDFYFKSLEAGTGIEINVDIDEWFAYTRTQPSKTNVGKNTFSAKAINNPPTLQSINDKQGIEGTLLSFTLQGSDPDPGDVLTYTTPYTLPAGAKLNSSTGLFEWTPELKQAGTYDIVFAVSDGKGGSDSKNAHIVVNPVTSGLADSYPTSGEQLRVVLPPNAEYEIQMFVGKAHDITELKYSFQTTGNNLSTNYSLQITNPGGTSENYSNLSQYTYQKTTPTSGFWKIRIKNSSAKSGEILISPKLTSNIVAQYQAIHFNTVTTPGARAGLSRVYGSSDVFSVSVGILTGICSPDDYACMVSDVGVGFIPVVGSVKDVIQFTLGAFIGGGMKTVSFFTNDASTSAKADEYFVSAGLAGIGIGMALVGGYYVDDMAKAAKYAPRIAKLVNAGKKTTKVGKLGVVGERLLKYTSKLKIKAENSVALKYLNKADELDKLGKPSGEIFEYDMAVKIFSDPEEKMVPIVLGPAKDGMNIPIYAKKVPGVSKDEKILKWDYATARTTPVNSEDWGQITDMDLVAIDKASGKKGIVQMKLYDTDEFRNSNSIQIEQIRLALQKSDGLRLELGGGKPEDFEVFGLFTYNAVPGLKKTNGENSTTMSTNDSIYMHQFRPTIPYLSDVIRNSQGKVVIRFHTLEEFDNKGWYVERRGAKDSTYKTVSPLLFGFNNSSEQHNYEFTDPSSDSSGSYLYKLTQINTENFVTYVLDSILVNSVTSVTNEELIPNGIFLHQNYPNPFNPSTTLRYDLPNSSNVLVVVSDILGRRVSILENGVKTAGYHEIIWDAHNLPSGIYFAEIFVNENSAGRIKMLLTK